jgi:succinoglycan biosynthesis transport protein ExoP
LPELEEDSSPNLNESLDSLVRFLKRSRWWILLPFALVTITTSAVLALLPNRYTSSATLLVVQQQVPQRYVIPNSTTDLTSALQALKQEVLSRTQLLRMINDLGLYPNERKRLAPEQLVELMNKNIDIEPIVETPQQFGKDFNSFKISFTTENALLAQQVTNNLTSLFINEYLRTGAEQATNTTNFLHQQVQEKGKELEAQEYLLRNFKLQHVGELPEQQSGNLGILTGLQGQLQNTMSSLDRAQQQRALLQAELQATPRRRSYSDGALPTWVPGTSSTQISPVDAARNDLGHLEGTRSALLSKGYTASHPDVVRVNREIAIARDNLKRLEASAPPERVQPSNRPSAAIELPAPTDDPAIAQLKASLEANRVEIENLTKDQNRLKAQVAEYEARINETPVREQQEAGILRDTEALRQQYGELQKKEQESQLATNLEKQQGGEQFRLVDSASLPTLPSSPKRAKISLGGAGGGLALGLALAVFMQMRDTSFSVEKEVTKLLVPPFVLGIPLVRTAREERRRKFRNVLQWLAASAMLLVVSAAEFYVYKLG